MEKFRKVPEILDKVDDVRRLLSRSPDLESEVPQFVVVGLQSSGKSSVFQRTCKIRLPRDANVCRRVPIELCVRRSPAGCEPKIRVGKKAFDSADSEAVEKEIKSLQDEIRGDKDFSDQVVAVEVESRELPNGLVEELINSRIKKKSALILHVAPLNQDAGTINTWAIVNDADPDKQRTVIVLTKADLIPSSQVLVRRLKDIMKDDSDSEACRYFIVDGRAEEDEQASLAEVREWLSESPLMEKVKIGLPNLLGSLEDVLVRHILPSLPKLKESLQTQERACRKKLEEIGTEPPRSTTALMGGFTAFQTALEDSRGVESTFGGLQKRN
uniref:Dynamin GTPase domain-containing protein n=1 Tax=Chromera velia CCMP2878 TaxID=1169474 RepID=A0A0G4I6A9_9ALVE|eukprot:Cvel_11283.t1-p1 / transcript=Cvel_11283.t1 / gene=Cvel_11283 / organism=Chromera_velia_CCMP2878 / gene_product=Interferon-induced GTP-binding protein Mx, putative / transcript_product=Interferon-induced GTP-binding protein Mx, putative / location=Cvel_scaffold704:33823-34865(+) / protein_length=327 / sequence_SO=supercontig / SO=protein_coding / is_pseudo=false